MGRGYNHHLHQRNLQLHYRSTLLPMLCSRPTIKDVAIPRLEDRSLPFSTDPLSPKIGCMGQVKRNNRIIGFPASSASKYSSLVTPNPKAEANSNISFKYSKLKKIFSGKNLTATTTSGTSTSTATNGSNPITCKSASCRRKEGALEVPKILVSIEDMDPPLPVVRKVVQKQEDGGIWQRRFGAGGVQLKGLQLQQIQVNRPQFAPTTV